MDKIKEIIEGLVFIEEFILVNAIDQIQEQQKTIEQLERDHEQLLTLMERSMEGKTTDMDKNQYLRILQRAQ